MIEEQTISEKPVARPGNPDLDDASRTPLSVAQKSSWRISKRNSNAGVQLHLVLPGSLVAGAYRHYRGNMSVVATAKQHRGFVPAVRVAAVRPSDGTIAVSLPATTTAFEAANIFARTSGYIEKRYVDIGDQVSGGGSTALRNHCARTRSSDFPGAGDADTIPGEFAPDPSQPRTVAGDQCSRPRAS